MSRKEYLLSVGIRFPMAGIWIHKYFNVKKKYSLRSIKRLGFIITWTSYKRVKE